jgi:hypothetical protein
MKLITYISLSFIISLLSCSNSNNSSEFIAKTTGRYLYNSDEVIEVYFKENNLYMIWRGASNIKPLKVNDSTFYVKEMNEKIQFLTNPSDLQEYMVLVPKEGNNLVEYNFKKLASDEKVPSEYLLNDNYEKALNGYLDIKEKDSLDTAIDERAINSWGYKKLRENDHLTAINIFKINIALHPASSNVYDSLGQAFLKSGDTIQAIDNYKRSLALDSGNARAKRVLERLEKKD